MSRYDIGYKKPPKHTQFRKGQSGNPKGRKKGVRNLKTDIQEELSEVMVVTENGKPVKMSKQRVMVKSLCAKAIKGDTQSSRILIDLIRNLVELEEGVSQEVATGDEEIINRALNRMLKEAADV